MNKFTKKYWIIFMTVLLAYFVGNFYDNLISFFYPNLNSGILALTSFIFIGIFLLLLIVIINLEEN